MHRREVFLAGLGLLGLAIATLSTGGMRVTAARDINLNSNCCGPGTDTYTASGNIAMPTSDGG